VGILAIANSNRYDSGAGLSAGYSSLGVVPSNATYRAICPLAFNKNISTDWVTGIQVANVGGVSTDVNFRMVRANANPAGSGNSVTITKTSVGTNKSAAAYFPEEAGVLTGFEGKIFVEATNPSALIAASSSSTSYNTAGSAALYDCINY